MIEDKKVAEVNSRVTIGTIIKKNGYVVDAYQILFIEDAGDHWRGRENLRLQCVAVHSSSFGWDESIGRPDVQLSLETIDTADMTTEWHNYPTIPLYEIVDGKSIFECPQCGTLDYRRPSQASDPEPLCFDCEFQLRKSLQECEKCVKEMPDCEKCHANRLAYLTELVSSDSVTGGHA